MNSFEQIWYLISNYGTTFLEGLAATLILALFGTFVGLLLGIIFALIKDIKIKEDDNKVVIFFKKLLKGLSEFIRHGGSADIDDYDWCDADSVLQYALFGDVIYG